MKRLLSLKLLVAFMGFACSANAVVPNNKTVKTISAYPKKNYSQKIIKKWLLTEKNGRKASDCYDFDLLHKWSCVNGKWVDVLTWAPVPFVRKYELYKNNRLLLVVSPTGSRRYEDRGPFYKYSTYYYKVVAYINLGGGGICPTENTGGSGHIYIRRNCNEMIGRVSANQEITPYDDEAEELVVTPYPNPTTTGTLSLDLGEQTSSNPIDVTIYDLFGKNVFNKQILTESETNNEQRLDVSHLPNGTYFMKIAIDGKEVSKKIFVQK